MTKTGRDFEKWANKHLIKYQNILLLNDHSLTFEYDKEMSQNVLMQHGYNYPYKTTAIYYSDNALKKWEKNKKKELHDCLIHELCHSITDPLYSKSLDRFMSKNEIEDERERLTDHIANILIKLDI